jgi:hypothetical protein
MMTRSHRTAFYRLIVMAAVCAELQIARTDCCEGIVPGLHWVAGGSNTANISPSPDANQGRFSNTASPHLRVCLR